MNLKEIFDKAENGTLTYDQFMAAVTEGKAKFVDLSEGEYVAKQKYTDDLAARDTRIKTLDETLQTRDTDLKNLQTQLENAGNDSEKLNDLNSKFSELQKQYDKDTKAYQKQLKDQAYKFAVTEFANQQKFTSKAAKRDFEQSMLARNLQMENDVIIGATDFMTAYSQENEDAFVKETADPKEPTPPAPHFVDTTKPGADPSGANSNPFAFNFIGVRPHEK